MKVAVLQPPALAVREALPDATSKPIAERPQEIEAKPTGRVAKSKLSEGQISAIKRRAGKQSSKTGKCPRPKLVSRRFSPRSY